MVWIVVNCFQLVWIASFILNWFDLFRLSMEHKPGRLTCTLRCLNWLDSKDRFQRIQRIQKTGFKRFKRQVSFKGFKGFKRHCVFPFYVILWHCSHGGFKIQTGCWCRLLNTQKMTSRDFSFEIFTFGCSSHQVLFSHIRWYRWRSTLTIGNYFIWWEAAERTNAPDKTWKHSVEGKGGN